ncbi:conserved hypothetical protein [Ricinus communis]|uniref:Antitoxin Xre/MbcA/ParS-like toxin-binding domain-containing protein n=1 Tax=Ricinus communis TaxID=3988 RepID=B9TPN5_RICCO|nr:conserved hypothetical protein [Ricinus communis]
MRKPRTTDIPAAHEESKIETKADSEIEPGGAAPVTPLRHRVSTEEFVAALLRDEAEGRREELAAKVLLPSTAFRARLRMSPQALSRAVKAKRMYSLRGPSDEPVYPAFFTKRSPGRAVLERVCKALGDMPGGCKHFFLTSTRISLGNMTPLQALARGKEDEVLAAAEAFREG